MINFAQRAAREAFIQAARQLGSSVSQSAQNSVRSSVMDWMTSTRKLPKVSNRTPTRSFRVGGWKKFLTPPGRKIRTRRVRKFRAKRRFNQGTFQYSLEKGATMAPNVSGVVGHITCPRTQMQRVMLGAILMKLFARVGIKCPIPSKPMIGVTTGDTIVVNFQYGAISNDSCNFGLTAGATFTQALNACVSVWDAKIASIGSSLLYNNIRFKSVEYLGSGNAATPGSAIIDLSEAKIKLIASSMLKVQNRSVGEVGDENADDVDNVPIQGKIYSGWGTGPMSRFQLDNSTLLHGDVATGVIAVQDPADMSDAPLPTLFNGVKNSGFVKIMPGQINRHYLKYNVVMYLDTFCRTVVFGIGDNNPDMRLGKFGFMVLEKTLETNNVSPLAMSISYENQLHITSKIYNFNATDPVPEYVRL